MVCLQLNIYKTRAGFSFSKTQIHPSIDINGEMVERVEHFRYLGITLDDHLNFNQHILGIYKSCEQRLKVLRKLKQMSVQPCLLLLYRSIIEQVLMYGAICFFRMLTFINMNKCLKIPHLAGKMIGIPTPKWSDCVTSATIQKAQTIKECIVTSLYITCNIYNSCPCVKYAPSVKMNFLSKDK